MTRRPAPLRLFLPVLLVLLAGCGGSAEQVATGAPTCAVPAAPHAVPAATAAGTAVVPRPVDARDDRELSALTPEQAALVQRLRDAEQAPAQEASGAHHRTDAGRGSDDDHAGATAQTGHAAEGLPAPAAEAHAAEDPPAPATPCTEGAQAPGAGSGPAAEPADVGH